MVTATATEIPDLSADLSPTQRAAAGKAARELMSPRAMGIYAHVCGGILARAHARSGDRIAIGAYLGGGSRFDEAIADSASAYADQNEEDFGALKRAVADGRIAVELEG